VCTNSKKERRKKGVSPNELDERSWLHCKGKEKGDGKKIDKKEGIFTLWEKKTHMRDGATMGGYGRGRNHSVQQERPRSVSHKRG